MRLRRRELVFKLRLPVLLMQHKLNQQAHKLQQLKVKLQVHKLHKEHKLQPFKAKPLVQ